MVLTLLPEHSRKEKLDSTQLLHPLLASPAGVSEGLAGVSAFFRRGSLQSLSALFLEMSLSGKWNRGGLIHCNEHTTHLGS